MNVIGARPDGAFLIDLGDERGLIVDGNGVHEPHSLLVLEARSYWQDFTGDPRPVLAMVDAAVATNEVRFATIEVPVVGYPRVREGKLEHVRPHMREVEVSGDPFAGRFDIPIDPKEAATKAADAQIAGMANDLRYLETLDDDELGMEQGEMAVALIEERRRLKIGARVDQSPEQTLAFFKGDDPELSRRLALARGDRRARAGLIRRLTPLWDRAYLEMVQPDQAELMERESREVFNEPKMAAIAKVYGLPELFAAHARYNPEDAKDVVSLMPIPVAEFIDPSLIVTYDQSSRASRTKEVFVPGRDTLPHPGQPITGWESSLEAGKNFKGTLRHEYGHMVGGKLSDGSSVTPIGFQPLWYAYATEYRRREKEIQAQYDPHTSVFGRREDELAKLKASILSLYSLNSAQEAWAEVFAIITHPKFRRDSWNGVMGEEMIDWAIEKLSGSAAFR